jgi:hypothetical protein
MSPSEVSAGSGSNSRFGSERVRALAVTTVFPNSARPLHGLFMTERIKRTGKSADMRVVVPVPWYPWIPRRAPRLGVLGEFVVEQAMLRRRLGSEGWDAKAQILERWLPGSECERA